MNKLARNTLALGTATLIVTAGLSFSANGADPIVARANSSAITASGITQIINSGQCTAESSGPDTSGSGICGTGLGVSQPVAATFNQTASTTLDGKNGKSKADAEIANVGINALTAIDLSNLARDVGTIQTGTILDTLIGTLEPLVLRPLFQSLLTPLLTAVQTNVLTPVLTSLQGALPVAVNVAGVTSTCQAIAGQPTTGNGNVAGLNITVDLPGNNDVVVKVALPTSPNSPVVGSISAQEIVNGLVTSVQATLASTLTATIGSTLTDPLLLPLIGQVNTALLAPLTKALGDALLNPVGQAIKPILDGTFNKQVKAADGSLEVTALDLNVLGNAAKLALGRTKCGPNAAVVVNTPTPTPTPKPTSAVAADDSDAAADAAADADTVADADAAADADVTTTLPATGAPNLLPFWLLGIALLMFGAAVLLNEKRRLNQI